MWGKTPGLRPLSLVERHYSWIYALMPSALIYMGLLVVTYFLTQPDENIFTYVFFPTQHVASVPVFGVNVPVDFQMILARAFYPVAYFTWGRTTGHLVVRANVIDRKTGRRIGARQKLVRGLVQMAGGSLYWVLDFMSFLLILLDREERRSVYDWIAGTVVVIGDLPPEEAKEASRSWVGELARALRGKAAPETR